MTYDSAEETKKHIATVRGLMGDIIIEIAKNAFKHDASKLEEPEKSMFDEFTPKLRNTTYGSDEYKRYLEQMGAALKHHYENNPHHPEHHKNGIDDMDLMDIVEMLCDWVAASRRHADGSVRDSLAKNKTRFGVSPQLYRILNNTAVNLGWLPSVAADYDEDL